MRINKFRFTHLVGFILSCIGGLAFILGCVSFVTTLSLGTQDAFGLLLIGGLLTGIGQIILVLSRLEETIRLFNRTNRYLAFKEKELGNEPTNTDHLDFPMPMQHRTGV